MVCVCVWYSGGRRYTVNVHTYVHVNACTCAWCVWEGERGEGAPIVCEEESYKVKFSGGRLEAVESEGEGDGGILHL